MAAGLGVVCIVVSAAAAGQPGRNAWASPAWASWVVVALIGLFSLGLIQSVRTFWFARRTIRSQIDRPKPTLDELRAIADRLGRPLPFVLILVPARNESAVIRNTINRIARLDYPRDRYAMVVIADARELRDNVPEPTRAIASRMAEQLNAGSDVPFLHVIEVPEWYSGRLGDRSKTYARSTKGRALNYALDYVRDDPGLSQADMLGVLDADGRLHTEVLREVTYLMLTRGERLMQGPVFQISNFTDVGLVGKAAGIELSMYHLSTLSRQLIAGRDTARFLAGTNYFVEPRLMIEVGGWDERALVEDAELGLRLFLRKRVRPAWLSCHEVEQTPPDRKTYLRQRQRWALGHFQLLPMIRRSNLPWHAKAHLHAKVLYAVIKCPFDVGLPVLAWVALALGWTAAMRAPLDWVMVGLLAGSVFVWDYFGRGAWMLSKYAPVPQSKWALWRLRLGFIAAMPWLILLQAQPRITAFCKYVSGRHGDDWQKTPRTVEVPTEPLAEGPS